MKVRDCDGCRFCCWTYYVPDVPSDIRGIELKEALNHCAFECQHGCSIYNKKEFPQACKEFFCPYTEGVDIHKPDTFQELLESLNGNVGSYIPNIPINIPVNKTKDLIKQTRSLPAFIMLGEWVKVVMSLDRNEDYGWSVDQNIINQWNTLFETYGEKLYNKKI